MARLPTPGSDNGVWGDILNDFLSVEHNADGTLKATGTIAGKIDKSTVTAKGDLLVANAASTLARLGVGGNGQRLVADSSQTTGIKWETDGVLLAVDYGAKFDGATDDASALQSAITAAISANKPLVLAPGVAVVGTALSVTAPVTIIGAGREATTLKAKNGLNNYVIVFNGSTNGIIGAHFSDFTIDGNGSNQTAGGGIKADGAVQCSFERIHVANAYDWGLKLGPISGGAFGHHNRIVSCLFDQTVTPAGFGGGVWMTSNDENWFIATDFEGLGGSSNPTGSSPIMMYDQAGLQHIISCNFVGGTNNCIGIRVQNALKTKIIGSTFDGTGGDSIFLVANKCVVSGNLITSPGDASTSGTYSGIHLEFNTHFNVISGNSLETSNTVSGKVCSLIREESTGGGGDNLIEGNSVTWGAFGPTVGLIESAGANTIVRNNIGWTTEKSGTATVANGTTSVTVNHGLDATPAAGNITVTPTNSLGSASKFWVSNITSTQITITVNADPGVTTATFAWFARM